MEKYTAHPLDATLLYRSLPLPPMDTSYKIDEGYSEETRSQDEVDSPMRLESNDEGMATTAMRLAMDSIMSLGEDDKSEFVYTILQTLRTSSIAQIVERLRPHLHKDPVAYLPPEVTSEIFSYLTPSMLLDAARVSQSWRERTLDSRLWKQKFYSEGWDLELEELKSLEQSLPSPRKTRGRRAETHGEPLRQKKRIRAGSAAEANVVQTVSQENFTRRQEAGHWNEQSSAVEADEDEPSFSEWTPDEEMQDAYGGILSPPADFQDTSNATSSSANGTPISPRTGDQLLDTNDLSEIRGKSANSTRIRRSSDISMGVASQHAFRSEPPLVTSTTLGQPRLNYQQLYKQRRKLEDNWLSCAYKSFQLPHRDHAEEAHGECVYTIQYIGRYLVSGSRDRTLRKWDLETQRLIGKPMQGHSASVLCLQFDNSKDEDVVISGSSDTDVIVWRYSTGELLERISQAHREPVLNLKFDHRFLVTCSKDKTIKIWNRKKLSPGDQDYPIKGTKGGGRCPSYIFDLSSVGANPFDIHKFLSPEQREPLREYTTLMTLDSHSAAVNAIHICKDQLVSASGDRFIKVWNIHTGECTATCRGHQKGIACVQYDGKRIISGSSDNTIRIYDPETQGEVACLQGHSRLVRTIQSAFEDLPGSRDQLEKEAQEIDGQFFLAHGDRFPEYDRSRRRNPGSNKPKNMTAVGAKLPPGGGGSRWGRIVSGSYDETIIIWRKGSDGRWVPGHRLRQEEALRAAGGPLASISDHQAAQNVHIPLTARRHVSAQRASAGQQAQPHAVDQHAEQVDPLLRAQAHAQHGRQTQQRLPSLQQPQGSQAMLGVTPTTQQAQPMATETAELKRAQTSALRSTLAANNDPETASSHLTSSRTITSHSNYARPTATNLDADRGAQPQDSRSTRPQQQIQDHQQQHQLHRHRQGPPTTQQSSLLDTDQPIPSSSTRQPPVPPRNALPPSSLPTPNRPTNPNPLAHNTSNAPPPAHGAHTHIHPPHHHHTGAGQAGAPVQQPNARVFKLQFDARRIICCSQDPKIVGWDFANGDERIIEASRFFKAPQ